MRVYVTVTRGQVKPDGPILDGYWKEESLGTIQDCVGSVPLIAQK